MRLSGGGFKFEVQRIDDDAKEVKGVRYKQFRSALPSEDLTRTGTKFPGDGVKLVLSETGGDALRQRPSLYSAIPAQSAQSAAGGAVKTSSQPSADFAGVCHAKRF